MVLVNDLSGVVCSYFDDFTFIRVGGLLASCARDDVAMAMSLVFYEWGEDIDYDWFDLLSRPSDCTRFFTVYERASVEVRHVMLNALTRRQFGVVSFVSGAIEHGFLDMISCFIDNGIWDRTHIWGNIDDILGFFVKWGCELDEKDIMYYFHMLKEANVAI